MPNPSYDEVAVSAAITRRDKMEAEWIISGRKYRKMRAVGRPEEDWRPFLIQTDELRKKMQRLDKAIHDAFVGKPFVFEE